MGLRGRLVYLALFCGAASLGENGSEARVSTASTLPPVETFILEPIALEYLSIWVPASMSGPNVNRSCGLQRNRSYACLLPASVHHVKSEVCPDTVARVLAEHVAPYHERSLPLTIFNGWQWEYSYGLSQYESVCYDLPARGGSWQYALEATLCISSGMACGQWLEIPAEQDQSQESHHATQISQVTVETFDSIRVRDGYPKIRQF